MMHENMEITDRLYGRLAKDDVRSTIFSLKERLLGTEGDEKLFE
jgi:hypothetical protein